MLTLLTLCLFWQYLNCLVFIQAQKITLFEYRQEDSETNCTYGLISGVDTVVFKAQVDYTEDVATEYVHIYIKRKTDLIPVPYKFYNMQDDCKGDDNYDCKHTDTYVVDIMVRVKAAKEYSGARIHLQLFTSDSIEIVSEDQLFPQIYDVTDVTSRLIVNGKEICTISEDCFSSIHVSESDVNIVYACESQVSPCWIEISTNDSNETVHGKSLIIYSTRQNKMQELSVTIKYGACRLDKAINTFKCNIKTEQNSSTERILSLGLGQNLSTGLNLLSGQNISTGQNLCLGQNLSTGHNPYTDPNNKVCIDKLIVIFGSIFIGFIVVIPTLCSCYYQKKFLKLKDLHLRENYHHSKKNTDSNFKFIKSDQKSSKKSRMIFTQEEI